MIRNPCAWCGTLCPPQPHQGRPRKWCSGSCRAKATRMRTCEECGQSYSGVSTTCLPCRMKGTAKRASRRREAKRADRTERTYGQAECPICRVVFVRHQAQQVYCSASCRESRRNWSYGTKAASAEERGYGKAHRAERARWKPIVDGGQAACCICGRWIEPGTKWHLDHTEDRSGYRGVAHAQCNLRDGARRGARRTNARRQIEKQCATCQRPFVTSYPKQTYCSAECRPKARAKPRSPSEPSCCADCGTTIRQGKRCASCRVIYNRSTARNAYRQRVGIPLDAPRYSRAS
jgi:hypothetical protein